MDRISLTESFGRVSEHWRPKLLAAPNGQAVKIVKAQVQFPWPHHEEEAEVLIFEPAGVVNTGNVTDPVYTAPVDARL